MTFFFFFDRLFLSFAGGMKLGEIVTFGVTLITAVVAAQDVRPGTYEIGSCGEKLSFEHDTNTCVLRIYGTGEMYHYSSSPSPWYGYKDLVKTIIIEDGATSIGYDAFRELNNLLSVSIPSSVTFIGDSAFKRCHSLPNISIPQGVTYIGNYCFYECRNLTSISIPEGVTTIGSNAFSRCSSLSSVSIPSSVTTIKSYAFDECNNLTTIEVNSSNPLYESINNALVDKQNHVLIRCSEGLNGNYTIPSDIISIGYYAFSGCRNLTSIILPDNLREILDNAFDGCENLISLSIPSTVTTIGSVAFSNCTKLKSITYRGSSDPYYSTISAFSGCESLRLICVSDSYESTTFCGKNISCKSSDCEGIIKQDNECYEVESDGNECTVKERNSTIEWEQRSYGCIRYECTNSSGRIISNKCLQNGKELCVNDVCVNETTFENNGWMVELSFSASDSITATSSIIASELSELIGIDAEKISIGVEYDNQGRIIRIEIHVSDEKTANTISSSLKDKTTCQGCICRCTQVSVREITKILSTDIASNSHYNHAVIMTASFFTLSLLFTSL